MFENLKLTRSVEILDALVYRNLVMDQMRVLLGTWGSNSLFLNFDKKTIDLLNKAQLQ